MPLGLPVRPTTDFAKEGLFNILNNRIDFEGLRVLDLFCGTGNIAFEFASRGAKTVTAVDLHQRCVKFVGDEAHKLKLENIHALKADVFKYVKQQGMQYDLVFADPPYESEKYFELYTGLMENNFLAEGGMLILEHHSKLSFADAPFFKEERKYGNVHFSFFER